MVKLKRLKILKYRNVRPGTELRFDDGVNLILGQNASGKTTLLALISAVCRGDFTPFQDEECEIEADARVGDMTTTLFVSSRRRPTRDEHVTPPGNQPLEIEWRTASTSWRKCPPMSVHWWTDNIDGHPVDLDYSSTPYAMFSAYRFDESLGTFAATTGRTLELAGAGLASVSKIEREDLGGGNSNATFSYIPEALVELLLYGEPNDPIFHRPLGSADLDFCRELADICDASNISLRANFLERRIRAEDIDFKIAGFTFELTRPDGTIIHHDRLSYGQKRLLAFFYYLACNPAVVIADELVNGLHHRWIDACMKAIGERQAFLTSQNPLLFDYVEFDSVEQVRSRFITCRIEQVDGRERMVWENMSEEDATRFFDAYQAGIEHVGDILITRGMW